MTSKERSGEGRGAAAERCLHQQMMASVVVSWEAKCFGLSDVLLTVLCFSVFVVLNYVRFFLFSFLFFFFLSL